MSVLHRLNTKWKNTFFTGIFLLASIATSTLFVSPYPVYAAPGKINYQGRLTDTTGAAKPDGQYNMKFRIYDTLSGGTVIWSEVRETTNRVTVTNGQFNVQLGDVTSIPSSAFSSDTRYFEVELPTPATATCSTAACGTYTEGAMTPRQPVASSAYALTAQDSNTLDGIDSTSFAQISSSNIFTGTNLFKNASNSTSAFGVQTATSVVLMNVDTTASTVTIGTNGAGGAAITTLGNGNVGVGNVAPGYTLDVAGNALFKNATDTATAFQVQSSTAATLFTVDTLNSRVVIGSSTADAIGVVLLLDNKNTAGDPTFVAGGMYYNSNMGKFRCAEDPNTWQNCTPSRVYTIASNTSTTSLLPTNIPGLSFFTKANVAYNFKAIIHYDTTNAATGLKLSVNSAGSIRTFAAVTRAPLTASTEWIQYINAFDGGTVSANSAFTVGNTATIEGMVSTTTDSSVQMRYAMESGGTAIAVKAGSSLMVW